MRSVSGYIAEVSIRAVKYQIHGEDAFTFGQILRKVVYLYFVGVTGESASADRIRLQRGFGKAENGFQRIAVGRGSRVAESKCIFVCKYRLAFVSERCRVDDVAVVPGVVVFKLNGNRVVGTKPSPMERVSSLP